MAESSISSAVALPEPDESRGSSPNSLKRRQSVNSAGDSKRRRISTESGAEITTKPSQSATAEGTQNENENPAHTTNKASSRRQTGAEEERKRGRRLFGGLLGTLSQSSSSAAERRRADIEKKQQTKLKLQDQEYNELTRKKYEDLVAERRKEQKLYDKQSLYTRHSNMLAMAHFLKTMTEPVLYFKPWQLSRDDEDKIQQQVEETEASIAREVEEFERRNPPEPDQLENQAQPTEKKENPPKSPPNEASVETSDGIQEGNDTVGADTNTSNVHDNHEQPNEKANDYTLTTNDVPKISKDDSGPSAPKGHEDDSEDVLLEDKEDTVIF